MPLLVTETALLPSGAFFIAVVGFINTTLTAVKPCKAHAGFLFLSGDGAHCHFVEAGVLHTTW
jgi:hypothetical protein